MKKFHWVLNPITGKYKKDYKVQLAPIFVDPNETLKKLRELEKSAQVKTIYEREVERLTHG